MPGIAKRDSNVVSGDLTIRPEQEGDAADIREVILAAFPTAAEADLVGRLRRQGASVVSLVADDDGAIVGHVLFSPVTMADERAGGMLGLAPLAVRPERQRQGIGSRLVHAGLEACRQAGAAAVVVVGHPAYYPRFGFIPASRFGLRCEYDVADDVFMVVELVAGVLPGTTGLVRYHPSFADL
jgi:putative acetyltransferase